MFLEEGFEFALAEVRHVLAIGRAADIDQRRDVVLAQQRQEGIGGEVAVADGGRGWAAFRVL
ncbi:MAG: hypothetical protein U0694_11095 [Anaerolineae bacterium]